MFVIMNHCACLQWTRALRALCIISPTLNIDFHRPPASASSETPVRTLSQQPRWDESTGRHVVPRVWVYSSSRPRASRATQRRVCHHHS